MKLSQIHAEIRSRRERVLKRQQRALRALDDPKKRMFGVNEAGLTLAEHLIVSITNDLAVAAELESLVSRVEATTSVPELGTSIQDVRSRVHMTRSQLKFYEDISTALLTGEGDVPLDPERIEATINVLEEEVETLLSTISDALAAVEIPGADEILDPTPIAELAVADYGQVVPGAEKEDDSWLSEDAPLPHQVPVDERPAQQQAPPIPQQPSALLGDQYQVTDPHCQICLSPNRGGVEQIFVQTKGDQLDALNFATQFEDMQGVTPAMLRMHIDSHTSLDDRNMV